MKRVGFKLFQFLLLQSQSRTHRVWSITKNPILVKSNKTAPSKVLTTCRLENKKSIGPDKNEIIFIKNYES
jgi:hypothetical protein